MLGTSFIDQSPAPRSSTARAVLAALMLFCALPSAHAYDVYIAPAFLYGDGGGAPGTWDSQAAAVAGIQAYWDAVGREFNRTYTVTNVRPDPASNTVNGVRQRALYDMVVCSANPCTTSSPFSNIGSVPVCPPGIYPTVIQDSPTSQTAYCRQIFPDAQPPPKCESCVGNPIYPATGQKVQVETDYVGVPGLTFTRTYRSNVG